MSRRENAAATLLMAVICAGSLSISSALAAASNADVVNAIEAAHVFDQSTRLSVRISGDTVDVSTYRDEKENENDRKINAVLVAKAVIDSTGDSIVRVNVYYYGRDLSSFQQVSVSAGDVKAYGSGQTSREQLLSSLTLRTGQQQNESDKVASQLQSTAYSRPDYKVAVVSGDLAISTFLGDWVTDDDAKLEALKIANNAARALPPNVSRIKVDFVDPRGGRIRQVAFNAGDVQSIWQKVQTAVGPLQIAIQTPTGEIGAPAIPGQLKPGPLQPERAALMLRLTELEKKGIGISPFMRAFQGIEQGVGTQDEGSLKSAIDHLNQSLDDQEKAMKAAKEAKAGPVSKAPPTPVAGGHQSRWVLGDQALPEAEILNDPDKIVNRLSVVYGKGYYNAELNPKFLIVLDRVASTLRAHNRAGEAARFEQRANSMRSKGVR